MVSISGVIAVEQHSTLGAQRQITKIVIDASGYPLVRS